MTHNELSEIEIKLINASRDFSEEQNTKTKGSFNYSVEIKDDSRQEKHWIGIVGPFKRNNYEISFGGNIKCNPLWKNEPLVWVCYEGNGEKGIISIGRIRNEEKYLDFQKEYQNFLIREIPKIKNRIK